MKVIKNFLRKVFSNPRQAVWLSVLIFTNLVIPLFFYSKVEAKAIFFCICLAFLIGIILFKVQGFTYLLGIMHFVWFWLIFFLFRRLESIDMNNFFGVWIRLVIILNAISLVFDVKDVFSYIRGNRTAIK